MAASAIVNIVAIGWTSTDTVEELTSLESILLEVGHHRMRGGWWWSEREEVDDVGNDEAYWSTLRKSGTCPRWCWYCNHPAPTENIILNMGGNLTWDWLGWQWSWTGGYDERRHMLKIEGLCNHPAPSENIILNMGGNLTPDWLHKTLWFLRDGSKWKKRQDPGLKSWELMTNDTKDQWFCPEVELARLRHLQRCQTSNSEDLFPR